MDEEEELDNTLIGQEEEEAPAVNTEDALIGAGQVNFRDYDVPAPPRTAALSVFTPGGNLRPDIDVNAITPSPTTLPEPSAVNTALNQESFFGTLRDLYDGRPAEMRDANNPAFEGMSAAQIVEALNDPNFRRRGSVMPNIAESTEPKSRVGQVFDDRVIPAFARAGDISLGLAENLLTPGLTLGNYLLNPNAPSLSESFKQVRGAIPDSPLSRAVSPDVNVEEMAARQDQLVKNFLADQASESATKPPAAITSSINPFTGETIENPTPFDFNRTQQQNFMDANQQAVANAMANQNQQISNAQIEGATQGQEAAQGQAATTPSLDQTLSQFMRNEDAPEQRTEQFVDPQGRLRRRLTPEASALRGFAPGVQPLAPEYTDFERESLARQERIGETGRFVSDRERRATRGEGISMADRTAMAKANESDATPREVAYGNQVAAELGVDVETGLPLETETEGLSFDDMLALRKQKLLEEKFEYELAKDLNAELKAGIKASEEAATDEAKAESEAKTMLSAISNMNNTIDRMLGRSDKFFGSGFFGGISSIAPASPGYDQKADAEFLQSNIALNVMTELKKLSDTGATGFGSLSERELGVLTAKFANLNPFVSPDLFRSNINQLRGEFNTMLDNAWNTHSAEYGEDAANKIYGNRGGGASGTTGGAGGTATRAIPNDRNVASAADALLSDPKYN